LKAELRAAHDAAPDDYLSNKHTTLPPNAKTPDGLAHYENYAPTAIWRNILDANYRIRELARKHRRHRATGRPRGPKNDDATLARQVYRLMQDYQVDRAKAERIAANALVWAEPIEPKTAMARVRRAMRKLS
jgi:hypothetical protein